jgi:hypothetical protein
VVWFDWRLVGSRMGILASRLAIEYIECIDYIECIECIDYIDYIECIECIGYKEGLTASAATSGSRPTGAFASASLILLSLHEMYLQAVEVDGKFYVISRG